MALVNRSFMLDITPGAIPKVINASEYDQNRDYTVTLIDEGGVYAIPSGTTAKVEGSIGGNAFSETATVSGNTITFTLSESMTAKAGDVWCKIKLVKDSKPIQTCAFILRCDRAGVEADTVIGAPGFEEQIREAAEDWLEEQGFQSPIVSITPITGGNRVTFTDAEHPQGQSIDVMDGEDTGVVTDDTLSVEGAAADAAAVGAFKSEVMPAVNAVNLAGIEVVVDKTEYESNAYQLVPSTAPRVSGEVYSSTTGEPVSSTSDVPVRIDEYFPVYPGSSLSFPGGVMRVCFYALDKTFINAVTNTATATTVVTVPSNAYYARFSSYLRTLNYNNIKTNVEVKSISVSSSTLNVDWNHVSGKETFVETANKSIEISNRTSRAFKMYDFVIQSGEIVPVQQGKVYATNPYVAGNGTGFGGVVFYDSEMQPILFPSTSNGLWGGFRTNGETTAPKTRGGQYFTINGNVVSGYHIHSNPRSYDFELPSAPAYLKFSAGPWTVGESTYADEISDDLQWVLYDEENNRGFLEQIQNYVVDGILTSATTSELGRWMRFNAIKEANKKIHAFRVASFNIYGAGKRKSNWSAVRDALQNYGIDLIGFQEVYDPLDETTQDGVKFADVMASWQFNQFDDVGQFKACACTSEFVMLESSYVAYTTQSGYGARGYVKTEVRLPRWKAKNWSNYIKASIYNTQLEVGANQTGINTRLAQVAELTAAMNADPNPFIILTGDFNEMATDRSTFAAIAAAGYTPVLDDDSTPTSYRGYYDNIFVNDRISIVDNDVIPYSDNGSGLSDHGLLFADVVFDYSNIIAVKKSGEHCTISGVEDWLDRRQTEHVTVTITPDSGYTISAISTGQGDNDLTYNNGAVVKNGNTITIKPNLVVGDVWISVTTAAS